MQTLMLFSPLKTGLLSLMLPEVDWTASGRHRVIPIPAYDIEGKLIDPRYYRRHLEGAVAEVHFNLSHWSISRHGVPGKDVYTADMVLIRVLTPPRAYSIPRTPLKRKVSAFIHPDSSPTKRARA